jgi:hypothetical protein
MSPPYAVTKGTTDRVDLAAVLSPNKKDIYSSNNLAPSVDAPGSFFDPVQRKADEEQRPDSRRASFIPPEMLRFQIELQEDIDLGDGTLLRPKKPLLVKVRKDTDGLHSSAPSISFEDLVADYDELISTTKAMCVLLWTDYAQEDDENLTADAQELKRRMQRDFEVV